MPIQSYSPTEIEAKWRDYWQKYEVYKVENDLDLPKYYVLDMFPYPSGAGLHVGHPLGYIGSDIIARHKRLQGYNVLHPMGYDAFGLPAEQYAIQQNVHPSVSTAENVARYRSQLDNIGFSFDWSREINTSDPSYYKWTQWIFTRLFDHYYDESEQKAKHINELSDQFAKSGTEGLKASQTELLSFTAAEWNAMNAKQQANVLMNYRLAYRQETYVNWCEELGTVLANDEVKDGLSERGGHPVERRPMLQWSLRITAYAERLLSGLDQVDWSDSMKKIQANWIGRSEGAQVFFEWAEHEGALEIFTTRPDTIFGVTFMVLAPEHDMVQEVTTAEQKEAVEAYIKMAGQRSELQRMSDSGQVTGVFTGAYVTNPFTEEKVPVWISDYVLKDYGTGAIMSVPGGDNRDHAFATKFNLPIVQVTDQSDFPDAKREDKVGVSINSGFLNGKPTIEAIEAAMQQIEDRNIGSRQVNYKLRDAIFSRQRYWGEPFPIVFDADGIAHALPGSELPLELPELTDFKPASGGQSPLARKRDWVKLSDGYTRETDTMPGFAGSSWYYLRYMDPHNDQAFAGRQAMDYWKDVDVYVGGTEHAVGHLLYSRFWNKFLYDLEFVPMDEPFKKLVNQGMIQGVIEFVYLDKQKHDGYSRFVCAGIAEKEMREQGGEFVKIPIHIDFVEEYGTENSHININSIKQFIDWRSEFREAIFECSYGNYQSGTFRPKIADAEGTQLYTHSEVGKMSKRYFNVINPDDVVAEYGADCFRMYEMFLGPMEQSKPWDMQNIDGVSKFLRRLWSMFFDLDGNYIVSTDKPTDEEFKILHTYIQKVSNDLDRYSFNTCVSHFMSCVNDLKKVNCHKLEVLKPLVILIAPFAPFITEELWHEMGESGSIHKDASYPKLDEKYLKSNTVTYPISVNGKKRAVAELPTDSDKKWLEEQALQMDEIQKWIDGKTVRKVIVVPGRMINIVVG